MAIEAEVVQFVAGALEQRADPEKAVRMQAYMKTQMSFYGVQKPGRSEVLKELRARFSIEDAGTYESVVRALWAQPHREEKYLAIAVARSAREFIGLDAIPLYRDLIVQGAWWDFVDEVAIRLVGAIWRQSRAELSPLMDQWINDEDMWLRRTAIIGQITHKDETDEDRLFGYCSRRMDETEFFIRKAIGWALREYSKTAPDAVRGFLKQNKDGLSGLSYREGAKRLA
ncbi:MAG: DNA alkylation repair protein [Thermoleophilia bacterium]|nr:DNA alkylation repair protein [Thermoleophilia bacterium]MDH3724583.1 DNA alkylation repair protein [Thermoleophilia bacterium]